MYGLELGRSVRRTGAGHIVRPRAQLVVVATFRMCISLFIILLGQLLVQLCRLSVRPTLRTDIPVFVPAGYINTRYQQSVGGRGVARGGPGGGPRPP